MSGPIVRTGTTPEFWKNWEKAFGKKAGVKKSPQSAKPATASKAKKITATKAKKKS